MASSYSRSPLSLQVKSKTWSRDSHGLYDYESRNVATHHLEISSECQIVRSESNVGVASADLACPGNPLLSVEPRNGQYHVSAALPEQLWLVVRHMHSEDGSGCQLREGDTLKLGRVELRVRELRGLEDTDSAALTQESSEEEPEVPSERDIGQCRVCFGEENDEDNPLVTPCACSGSVKYIHVACLQQWLDSRKVMRESENAINYHWRTMGCELCKDPYPLTISSPLTVSNPTDFSISPPLSTTIPVSSSTEIQVTFTPSTTGTLTSTIEIGSNDMDENPFTFVVGGTGIAPEIDVRGQNVSISSGDTSPDVNDDTEFGDLLVGSSALHTFTISNTGSYSLTLDGNVTLSNGTHFSISSQPTSPIAANSASTRARCHTPR